MINAATNKTPKSFSELLFVVLPFCCFLFDLPDSPPLNIKNLTEGFAERTGDTFALHAQN
jgi:hypothetical protein